MPISDATREEAIRLVQRYPVARSALLPLLHLVQSDEGYVSEDGIGLCAATLGLTKAEVGAVATFYTMFKREPVGDYLLSVCTNPTCKIAGAKDILDAYVESCGGHVDRDAGVMVEHAECLGICDAAPIVQVNYEMYGPLTQDEAMDLLEKARSGQPPASNWSEAKPATFREVERELSGIDDGVDDHLVEAARLQVTAGAPPAYRTGETELPVTHPGADRTGHGGAVFQAQSGLGGAGRRPEEQVTGDEDVVDDVAATTPDVAGKLAEQVTTPRPLGEPPAATEQRPLDDTGAAPAEAERGVPTDVESDPSTSTAGEAGPDEQLEDPDGRDGRDASSDEEA